MAGLELPDWLRGVALLGVRADGEMGIIGLDDKGRISAFLFDSSDAWGRLASIGNAEMAARLGCISKYDRRGNVLLMENFEEGMGGVQISYTVPIDNVFLDPYLAHSGGYSVRMDTDALIGDIAQMYIAKTWIAAGKIGLEAVFAMPKKDATIELTLSRYSGARLVRGAIKYDPDAEELSYRVDLVNWAMFAEDVRLYTTHVNWHHLKFVIDVTGEMYVRCLYQNEEHDLSTHALYAANAPAIPPHYVINVVTTNVTGAAASVYVDDIIATTAEP